MDNFKNVISFIQDTYKSKDTIPLHAPVFRGNEKKYLNETIDSTFVSSVGNFVNLFESQLSLITNTKKAIALVNGTSGLQIALKLIGVNSGDEVITQALTFVATANAITYNGATPVFLDVDIDTMGLSAKAVSEFLDEFAVLRNEECFNKKTGKKISACLPMHTFGFPVHMDELKKTCDLWKIPIIEDAAESLGSLYKNQQTGSIGEMGVFSFNGNKIITSGGGGAIITNNENLGSKVKHITTTAKLPHEYEFYHDELGFNFRMPNLNAALAYAQLEQLNVFLKSKRLLASKYKTFFDSLSMNFRTETPQTKANYWLMCVELESLKERNLFITETNKSNVMTRPIWQLMYRLPMYINCYRDNQTNAEYLEQRIVNIPSSVI